MAVRPSPESDLTALPWSNAARRCKWRRLTSAAGVASWLSRDSGQAGRGYRDIGNHVPHSDKLRRQAEAPPHSKDGEGSPFDMRGEYAKRRHEYPGPEFPSAISLSRQYTQGQTIYDRLCDALRVSVHIQALMASPDG